MASGELKTFQKEADYTGMIISQKIFIIYMNAYLRSTMFHETDFPVTIQAATSLAHQEQFAYSKLDRLLERYGKCSVIYGGIRQ